MSDDWGILFIFLGNFAHPYPVSRGTFMFSSVTATLIKKENKIFLIHKEIQSGAVAKSYMWKGFLIYEEMRKYFPIYEEAVGHI